MISLLDRISEIAKLEGISIGALEKRIGASKGVLSRAIQNKTDIQAKWLSRIVENYPLYSADWLLSGEGKMLKGKVQTFDLKTDGERSLRRVPVFELAATAGFSYLYKDYSSAPVDYLTIPNLPTVDGAIYARGDSMSPLIESGDIIIYKKVDLCPDNILWGNIYIVSYTVDGDDYTVLKYLRQSSRDGYIRLESFNSRYDPQDIPASSITALALVKASITFHTIG